MTDLSGYFHTSIASVVQEFHVYMAVWTPVFGKLFEPLIFLASISVLYHTGEEHTTDQENGNPEDQYAMAVIKTGIAV